MLRIKPLRLAGGYRVAYATAPERERPRTGFVALANAVPALPACALSSRWRVLPAACAVGHNAGPRLRRLHRQTPVRGARAPRVRTLVWGKSAAPIQHNAGLCKVRAVANKVGLVPAPLRPAAFAPFVDGAQSCLCCFAPPPLERPATRAEFQQYLWSRRPGYSCSVSARLDTCRMGSASSTIFASDISDDRELRLIAAIVAPLAVSTGTAMDRTPTSVSSLFIA